MWNHIWARMTVLALVLAAMPAWSQTEPASTETDSTGTVEPHYLDTLPDLSCQELEQVFYREIPRAVYDDLPDELYELVIFATDACDIGEPLTRTQILASIWDDNFQEVIYGYEVIAALADRYDPDTLAEPGSDREVFDTFTTDFASQMLPHVPSGSLEEFFCLYYSGHPAEAWDMLQSEDLEDTWLRYYYEEQIDRLSHRKAPYIVSVHWGGWQPGGDLEFVRAKHLVGVSIEQWTTWGYLRFVGEWRLGRTNEPYLVDEEGVSGISDRWNALLFGLDIGVPVWRSGPHLAEAFVGVGYDAVHPFKDEEFWPATLNLNLGVGYRWYPSSSCRWFTKLDGRYEWIGNRNTGGTNLGGRAWSARLGLGLALGKNPEPRLKALGQRD